MNGPELILMIFALFVALFGLIHRGVDEPPEPEADQYSDWQWPENRFTP